MWETDCALDHPVLFLILWPVPESCGRRGQSLGKPKSPFPPVLPHPQHPLRIPSTTQGGKGSPHLWPPVSYSQPSTFSPLPIQACALARTSFPYWSLLISLTGRCQDIAGDLDIGLFCQRCSLVMPRVFLSVMNNPPILKLPIFYPVWVHCKVASWNLPSIHCCERITSSQLIFWFCGRCEFQGDQGWMRGICVLVEA